MTIEGFPLLVSVPKDEPCLVVHRGLDGQHLSDRHCWCHPAVFTQDELNEMSTAQFNAAVKALTEVVH